MTLRVAITQELAPCDSQHRLESALRSRLARHTFDTFSFDAATGELFRDGSRVHLPNKAAEVLERLLAQPGELVARADLHGALWPADTFVDFDNNLNAAVRKLREAFGDDAAHPRFIQTLPRRGYRFLPTVQVEPVPAPVAVTFSPWRRRWQVASVLAAAASALLLPMAIGMSVPPLPVIAVRPFENLSGDSRQNHISKGLETELTTQLASTGRYHVKALHPVEPNRDTAAKESTALAPDFVVEGSARTDASGLFVTVRLLESKARNYVWAGSFHCPMGDSAAIERQVASKIAEALKSPVSERPSMPAPSTN